MRLTDFLGAELSSASLLAWVGAPLDDRIDRMLLPEGVSIREVSLASAQPLAADRSTVLAFELNGDGEGVVPPETRALLAQRQPCARSVLITHLRPHQVSGLGDTLAGARHRVVHVVHLDTSPLGFLGVGLSVEAVVEVDGEALSAANAARLAASPLSEPPPPVLSESAQATVFAALEESRQATKDAEHRAEGLERRLAHVEDELRQLRASATVQLSRAVASALHDPRHGLPALPGRTRQVISDRRRRSRAAANGTAARAGAPRRTEAGGRHRTFDLAMPDVTVVPDTPSRRTGARSRLHFDVPYSYFIPQRLERDGLAGYEPETLAWWLALCDVAPQGDAWDVGANTGLFATLAAATSTRDVVAFEPTPDLAWWARRIAADNDLDFTMEQLAASDNDGTATFFLSDSTDSSSSLAEGFRQSTRQIDVITERLDVYSGRTGRFPSVLKIDTETTEPAVLRGADALVRARRPWILCEVLANCGVEEPLNEMARSWGYRWYHVTEQLPPPEPPEIAGDPTFTYFMYLLAPERLDEGLLARVRAWRAALAACTPIHR